MRFIVTFLGLFSLTCISYSQAQNSNNFHYEEISANRAQAIQMIQQVSGRIIEVYNLKDYIEVQSACSGTLIKKDTVLTAGHCFDYNYVMKGEDKEKFERERQNTEIYFDIDGVTSKDLDRQILKLTEETGVITGNNIKIALAILEKLPKITEQNLFRGYIENKFTSYRYFQPTSMRELGLISESQSLIEPQSIINDLALAKLSKSIDTPIALISEYIYDMDVFVAGYASGPIDSRLAVYECFSGDIPYDSLTHDHITKINKAQISINNLRQVVGYDTKADISVLEETKKLNLEEIQKLDIVKNDGILAECPTGIITWGFSGGPIFTIKNDKVHIVGVTSTVDRRYGKIGQLILAPRATKIKSHHQ